jgi:hypothetical protein
MNDDRVRFEVEDSVYTRKLTVPVESIQLRFESNLAPGTQVSSAAIMIAGLTLENWLTRRIHAHLIVNPIVNTGELAVTEDLPLAKPLPVESNLGPFAITRLQTQFRVFGSWYRHNAKINGTAGLYDWFRRRVKMPPGQNQLRKSYDFQGGKPIKRPPAYVISPLPLQPGEIDFLTIELNGPLPSGEAPSLDEYLRPEDRILKFENIPDAMFTSTPGYVHQR